MKYILLSLLFCAAGIGFFIKGSMTLGQKISYNIASIRGEAITAQAYEMPNSLLQKRVIVGAETIMSDLSAFAYGTDVSLPTSSEQVDIEMAIYDMQGDWMSKLSNSCAQGKKFLSQKLYSHRLSGFSYNLSDAWLSEAKRLCAEKV